MSLTKYEASYKSLIGSLPQAIPDGIIQINLELLHKLDLIHSSLKDIASLSAMNLTFQVNEGADKLTLFNEKFVIWIVPQMVEKQPMTFVLVALNREDKPKLELVFNVTGVFNTSKIVLNVLQHYLNEIIDNEDTLEGLSKQV